MMEAMSLDTNHETAMPGTAVLPTTSFCELRVESGASNHYLLPLLAQFSRSGESRWLTCIDAQGLEKSLARAANIAADHMLCLEGRGKSSTADLMIKAISSGQSHTVVGVCGRELSADQRLALQRSAEAANCHCVVLTRPEQINPH